MEKLETLIFEFSDLVVEMTLRLDPSRVVGSPLSSVPVSVYRRDQAISEMEVDKKEGCLVYDVQKRRFITMITDYLTPSPAPEASASSTLPTLSNLERYASYQEAINAAFNGLYLSGLVTEGEIIDS